MSLKVISHEDCLKHRPPTGHPERPERLTAALAGISQIDGLIEIQAEAAEDEQILLAHQPDYLTSVKRLGKTERTIALDPDTHLGPDSLQAARLAAGAVCQGVIEVIAAPDTAVIALTRPPGHHAESARAMGFCLFNNVAIGAGLAACQGLSRVAICDFDVHHGNGTEEIVTSREGMLFLSSHQAPLYPGTGDPLDNRPGHIVNASLPAGSGSDEFRSLWMENLLPALEAFAPELVLVSAGFDAHWRDPLAGLKLKDEDYYWIGRELRRISRISAGGRLVATLEGGYDLKALEDSVLAFGEGVGS